jgi:hypothetical protein
MSGSVKGFAKPSFNPDTNQIDFGGVHLYYYGPEAMANDSGINHLLASFINAREPQDLAFAQKVTGGELAPGGSGYQLNKPEGGYTARDLSAIADFVGKMETAVDSIQKQVAQKAARVTQLG